MTSGRSSTLEPDIARGERAARKVLADLGIAHAAEQSIEDIAWLRGALVRTIPLRGCQGRLARLGARGVISVSEEVWYRPRQRFIVAHELGHLEIHGPEENQLSLCTETQIREGYDTGTEREANAFASELLMPKACWDKLVDVKTPSLEVIEGLAKRFEVSLVAAAIRFAKLCPERCAVVFSERSGVAWCAAGPEFGHFIRPGRPLDPYSVAYDHLNGRPTSPRPTQVEASAWLDSPRVRRGQEIVEDARPVPSLHAVLSLLWIAGDSDL
jgi:hypothetical protein